MSSMLLCHHFDENFFLSNAKKLLTKINSCKSKIKKDTVCLSCGYLGDLTSFDFQNHLMDHQHHFCMRAQEPHELYCSYCGDYQYSKSFDDLIGRKRRFEVIETKVSNQDQLIPLDNSTLQLLSFSTVGPSDVKSTIAASGNQQQQQQQPPIKSKKKSFVTRGICNMGSTCFMGSVLQVLLHTELLNVAISSNKITANIQGNSTLSSDTDNNNNNNRNNNNNNNNNDNFPCSKPFMETSEGVKVSNTKGCIPCELRQLFEEATCIIPPMKTDNETTKLDVSTSSPIKSSNSNEIPAIATSTSMASNNAAIVTAVNNTSSNIATTTSNNATTALIPAYLLYSVWTYAEYMAGYEQQDAHEFLVALLDGLETHLHKFHAAIVVVKQSSQLSPIQLPHPLSLPSIPISTLRNVESLPLSQLQQQQQSNPVGLNHENNIIPSSLHLDIPNIRTMVVLDGDDISINHTTKDDSNNSSIIRGEKQTDKYQDSSIEIVKEIFSGVMMSDLKCGHCGNRSCKYERFVDLSLTLDLTRSRPVNNSTIATTTNRAEGVVDAGAANDDNNTTSVTNVGLDEGKRSTAIDSQLLPTNKTSNNNSEGKDANKMEIESATVAAVNSTDNTNTANKPISKASSGSSKDQVVQLTSCLNEFTLQEQLSEPVTCEVCKEMRPCSKQLSIASPPQILVIQLKRFNPITQLKMSTHVSFPLTSLDLTPYMSHSLGTLPSTSAVTTTTAANDTGNVLTSAKNDQQSSDTDGTVDCHDLTATTTADYRLNTPNNNHNINSSSSSGSNTSRSDYGSSSGSADSSGQQQQDAMSSSRSRNSTNSVNSISSVPVSPRVYGSYAHHHRQQQHHHQFQSPHSMNSSSHKLSPTTTSASPSATYLSSAIKTTNHNNYNNVHNLNISNPQPPNHTHTNTNTASTLSSSLPVEAESEQSEPETEQVPIQSVTSADCLYDLYGVVCHSGTLSQGHYISYVLNTSGSNNDSASSALQSQWLRCDDEAVTAVSDATVQSSEAYILFYQRRMSTNN